MMRHRRLLLGLLLAVAPSLGQVPYAEAYADALGRQFDLARAQLPRITAVAEPVADRLIARGELLIGGSMAGFDIEGIGRAGGLCLLQRVTDKTQWDPGDTMLYGMLGSGLPSDVATIRELRDKGVMVIAFGARGEASRAADAAFLTGLTEHGLAVETGAGIRVAPLDGLTNLIHLWAFNAELVSALTRRGKMPTMFQSVYLEGARERNAAIRNQPFHDTTTVDPIAPGILGRRYLDQVGGHIEYLTSRTTIGAFDRAAELAVAAKRDGKDLYVWLFGHYPPYVGGTPGDPGVWQPLPRKVTPEVLQQKLKPGDVLLDIAYSVIETEALQAAKQAGAKTIAVVAGRVDGPPPESELPDVWIDPHWLHGDAELEIPGYDVPILPPSGIVQIAVYWMLTAEVYGRMP